MAAVKLENLRFHYPANAIFENLNLEIPEGTYNALVGKNGIGKSTLMKLLAGIAHPSVGSVKIFGLDTSQIRAELLNSIGYVSEGLLFSSPDHFLDILPIFRSSFERWDHDLEKELMAIFGLKEKVSFLEISRGQRMLFCFVLAACHKPKLYLIDEITSVLDPTNRAIVLDHIASEVKKGATAIVATNIVDEIQGYASRLLFLDVKSGVSSNSLNEFCQNFVRFHSSEALPPAQRRELGAILAGAMDGMLVYISKRENEKAIAKAGFRLTPQKASPSEAFHYLSQEEK